MKRTWAMCVLVCLLVAAVMPMAAAVAGVRKPSILFVHSQSLPVYVTDIVSKINSSELFSACDSFDAHVATPSLATLKAYDAVLVSNQSSWADRVALGNVMKDYVDAGGGVVLSVFANAGTPGSDLGGNWTGNYTIISFSSSTTGAATLGTITQVNHPIMNGVQTFDGGTGAWRPSGTALQAGSTLIASWSDGKPLVAVGSRANRADLGFWPVSKDVKTDQWVPSTDGVKLMANALMYVIRPKVLVVHSFNSTASEADVLAKLRATNQLSFVDAFNAQAGTPTLDQLKQYDAVLVSNNTNWQNRDALGNVIADYVDAGGGVVVSIFANGGQPNSNPGGRFAGTYEIIPFADRTQGLASLGAIVYPSHPILSGVASFNGGSSSYRPNQTTVNPGGLIVANWSDGKVLAAVSTTMHNRADLGFYPPSSDVSGDFWAANTGGARLMANALVYTVKPYIGLAHSNSLAALPDDVTAKLLASRRFSGVVVLPNLAGATPALATLKQFNAVFSWSQSNFDNANAVGDVFADYVDAGGGIAEAVFSVTGNGGFESSRPRGRWIAQGYDITPEGSTGSSIGGAASLGTILEPAHSIASFVRKFQGGAAGYRQGNDPLVRGRRIMNWSDGRMLASVHNFRKRADLGFDPPSDVASGDLWITRTDGTTMMCNAIEYVVNHAPCPGDLNGDGVVDDADFQLFLVDYNALLDPRGDLNGDGLTDDADFTIFVQGYNALLCPL